MMYSKILPALALVAAVAQAADWNGYAAPSVHLRYQATGTYKEFQNSVKPTISAKGTYFMVCGWNQGYYGIQQKSDGSKVLIFSLWDNGSNLAQVTYKAPGVTAGRFGGEGTGAQSFYAYNWSVGTTYDFKVTAELSGTKTIYSGWFNKPGTGWIKLISMSVVLGGKLLTANSLYSFVEDFYRNGVGPEWTHKAVFGQPYVTTTTGTRTRVTCAKFTTDGNSDPRVDAGKTSDNKWFLATGGSTRNVTTSIGTLMCVQ